MFIALWACRVPKKPISMDTLVVACAGSMTSATSFDVSCFTWYSLKAPTGAPINWVQGALEARPPCHPYCEMLLLSLPATRTGAGWES